MAVARIASAVLALALIGCTTAPGSDEAKTSAAATTEVALATYHWGLSRASDRDGQTITVLQPVGRTPLR